MQLPSQVESCLAVSVANHICHDVGILEESIKAFTVYPAFICVTFDGLIP
jgi:hypothetical protein